MTDVGDISFGVTVLVTVTVTVVEDIEVEDVVADEDDIAVEEVVADEDDIAVEEVVADEDDIELEEDDEEVVVPITWPWRVFDCRISRNIMAPSTAFGHIYK